MKSLLREIRKQPEGTRQLFFALSSVAVISLVVMVWFNSFRSDIYAMLNPAEATTQDTFLADVKQESLLGSLGSLFADAKGQFLNLMGKQSSDTKEDSTLEVKKNTEQTYVLPVSSDK